jgi:hypothetical protein
MICFFRFRLGGESDGFSDLKIAGDNLFFDQNHNSKSEFDLQPLRGAFKPPDTVREIILNLDVMNLFRHEPEPERDH